MALIEHIEKLRYFVKLKDSRSISEAALGMRISQAALSKLIQALEQELGVQLLLRSKSGFTFTSEGKELLEFAKNLVEDSKKIEIKLAGGFLRPKIDPISIGTYDSIALYLIPELVKQVRGIYGELPLKGVIGRSSALQVLLEEKKIDIAIAAGLKKNERIMVTPLFIDHYSFYGAPSVLGEMQRSSIIYLPDAKDDQGKSCREYILPSMKNRNFIECENLETVKGLAIAGLGIGILPNKVASAEVKKGALRLIKIKGVPENFGKHQIGLSHHISASETVRDIAHQIVKLTQLWSLK
jgi:DNA-binding transcriptional LysR family regulator